MQGNGTGLFGRGKIGDGSRAVSWLVEGRADRRKEVGLFSSRAGSIGFGDRRSGRYSL